MALDRDFKGVWIPKEVWENKELGWTEKILLVEIDSLSKLGECYASNEYLANFLSLSKDRVSKIISSLVKLGYIESKMIRDPVTKEVTKRIITTEGYRRKCLEGIVENADTLSVETPIPPIGENAEYINTKNIINTMINTKSAKPKKDNSRATLEEIKAECTAKGYIVNPNTFFTHYDTHDWIDASGHRVKSWKHKLITWNNKEKEKIRPSQPIEHKESSPPKKSLQRLWEDYIQIQAELRDDGLGYDAESIRCQFEGEEAELEARKKFVAKRNKWEEP